MQPQETIFAEKKHPLYSFYNGGKADITVTMNDELVETIVDNMGLGEELPGKAGKLAYKFFKKMDLEIATDDLTTLPTAITETMNSEYLNEQFGFWKKVWKPVAHGFSFCEEMSSLGHA